MRPSTTTMTRLAGASPAPRDTTAPAGTRSAHPAPPARAPTGPVPSFWLIASSVTLGGVSASGAVELPVLPFVLPAACCRHAFMPPNLPLQASQLAVTRAAASATSALWVPGLPAVLRRCARRAPANCQRSHQVLLNRASVCAQPRVGVRSAVIASSVRRAGTVMWVQVA